MICLFLTILGLLSGQGHGRYTAGSPDSMLYPNYQDLVQNMVLQGLQDRYNAPQDRYNGPQDRYNDELYNRNMYENWPSQDEGIQLTGREMGRASLRDQEYLEHSSNNDGYQYISGGAGEGKQHLTPEGTQDNMQEVKSDEDLPFYCHPPNPCPKGYKAKDGCQEFIQDTAESQQAWITEMQYKRMCQCDEEHMFTCPENKAAENEQDNYIKDDGLNSMIDELLKGNSVNNPYIQEETKREGLVAKKSPHEEKRPIMKRSIRQKKHKTEKHYKRSDNPYLKGKKLKRVAKKG